MPSDILSDGTRRMTYAELADVRGISITSARRLVLRHRWPRQAGNDGLVKVSVPVTALTKAVERNINGVTVTSPATATVVYKTDPLTDPRPDPVIDTLTRAVDSLREQLAVANARADQAERRIDELLEGRRRDTNERRHLIEALTARRPWWRNWFR